MPTETYSQHVANANAYQYIAHHVGPYQLIDGTHDRTDEVQARINLYRLQNEHAQRISEMNPITPDDKKAFKEVVAAYAVAGLLFIGIIAGALFYLGSK